jgi:hypothetical protein
MPPCWQLPAFVLSDDGAQNGAHDGGAVSNLLALVAVIWSSLSVGDG